MGFFIVLKMSGGRFVFPAPRTSSYQINDGTIVRETYRIAMETAIMTMKTAGFQARTFLPSSILIGSRLNAAIIALIWSPIIPMNPIRDTIAGSEPVI
jgi:hypothetical protein